MGVMSYFKEFQELEDQGIDLIEILGQDEPIESPEALTRIVSQLHRPGENLYSELLHYLTQRRFTPEQAESLWRGIMKHKRRMSEALQRKVSFRVAALDYLSSRNALLRQVRIIARPEFESILSFVNIDEVTSVYNRRYFNEVLTQEVHRARRYESPLSLLILDLDDFKRINDTFGHLEGDATLRKVGRLLRESTRQSDAVCRYGGDEFAVLLPETRHEDACNLAERMRKAVPRLAIERSSSDSVLRSGLTVSIGGATYPEDCDEAEELVAMADQMCLDAKRSGKDRVLMTGGGKDLPIAAQG